jgi:hypothetical protein
MQADPPIAEPPKRKRRWFQFSLRTLMIVLLADSGIESLATGAMSFRSRVHWAACPSFITGEAFL